MLSTLRLEAQEMLNLRLMVVSDWRHQLMSTRKTDFESFWRLIRVDLSWYAPMFDTLNRVRTRDETKDFFLR